jgi:anaerobic magnesium-protoporphyrin IX monomethyl ester cyclase
MDNAIRLQGREIRFTPPARNTRGFRHKSQIVIRMNITLATIHCNPRFTPLALLYLKAYLVETRGYQFQDVTIREFPSDAQSDDVASQILAGQPDVVGLSCYVWNVKTLMAASRRIKEVKPDIKIVLGGPEVGPLAKSVLRKHPYVDVVVKSEGEVPFSEIVEAVGNGGDYGRVRGIAFQRVGEIHETENAPILQDLNYIPSPHLLQYGKHKGRIICLETQRGCVFKCNFCFYNKDLSIRNRRFDVARVKEEIFFWLQQEADEIYLMDPVFNLNAARAKEICRFVAQHNNRKVRFHSEVWAEFIDEEMAQLFKEANFTFLEVGLQTTDGAVLAAVERRLKLKQFIEGISYLKKFDLKFELQLIYGLPGDTRASFKRSLDFAASLEPPRLSVFPLMVLPGTELWRKAEVLNLIFDPEPPYWVRSHRSMSELDVNYGHKIFQALLYPGNSLAFRLLCKKSELNFSDMLDEWIAWHDTHAVPESKAEKINDFLREFCAQRKIPEAFFRGLASLELNVEPLLNA